MTIYNKLVRDKIPEIIKKNDKKFDSHIAKEKEYLKLLEAKLMEEVNEFLEDKTLEELADIIEVVVAFSKELGYSENDLFEVRKKKALDRGAFNERIVLEKVYNK